LTREATELLRTETRLGLTAVNTEAAQIHQRNISEKLAQHINKIKLQRVKNERSVNFAAQEAHQSASNNML